MNGFFSTGNVGHGLSQSTGMCSHSSTTCTKLLTTLVLSVLTYLRSRRYYISFWCPKPSQYCVLET